MTEPDSKTSETSSEEAPPVESQGESPSTAASEGPTPTDAEAAAPEPPPKVEAASADGVTPQAEGTTTGTDAPAAEDAQDTSSGDLPADASTSSSGQVAAEGGKKKRRRRRKKKGDGAGPSEAPDAKGGQGHHHAPFLRFFSAGAGRKHAFSAGEVIAGRVARVADGAIVVDLFGKASAIVDADEPREIPVIVTERAAEERPSVVPDVGQPSEPPAEALEAPAPRLTPVVDAPGTTPTPVVAAPTPEMAKLAQGSDAESWDYSASQVSDIPYPDLGEADTVVGAQAYVEADTVVGAQPYDPTVPPAEPATPSPAPAPVPDEAADAEVASETEATAPAAAAISAVPQAAPEATQPEEPATEPAAPTTPPPEDLSDADLTLLEPLSELPPPDLGGIFRGRIGGVAESGHVVIVNRDVDKPAVRKAIRAAREKHQRVQGLVYGFNRGGFDVLVGGVRAFCPASAMSLTPIEDPNAFVGQRREFSLPQDKGGKRSIIVSRRSILEKEARKRARERMAELEVGEKLQGKVVEVRDYGVLVDLGGGLDGLVHMSEVSWSRGVRPSEAANVGDEVEVQVIKVQPATRKDRFGRVSLSMRACQPDPWDLAKDVLRVGAPVKGKVIRTTEFGAFIQVAENIEGLLHISELGGNKELTHAKQALTEGDDIDVVIERVDREQRRLSLSKLSEADAKALAAGDIEIGKTPRSLKPGSHISVIVKRVEHGGAQVQVDGVLGKRGRGFIPNRELQDVRGERRKGPSQGDVIDVKVIGTERDGTLRCSIRARLLDEERRAVRDYRKESAKQGLGTFGDLLKAKLGDSSD
ncbi:MAG: S1 RNA-binding domain-containing protein [Myxococcota bacterium]